MFTQINDIKKLPKKITYKGSIYYFTIYTTVWEEVCIGYRNYTKHEFACHVVIGNKHYDINTDNYNIGEAPSFEEAVNMLYDYVMNNPEIEVK